jgi:hypothetical protein
MRCREAKGKLAELARGTLTVSEEAALRDHLDQCPDCAGRAEAAQIIFDDLAQLRQTEISNPMTIEQVRREISRHHESQKDLNWGVRIMQLINENIRKRPRLSIITAAAVILLLASALVPIKTEYPGGYEVAFAAPAHGMVLNQERAEELLAAMGIYDAGITVNQADADTEFRIAPLTDSTVVRKLIMMLDSLGSRRVRSLISPTEVKNRTIWQLLFKDESNEDKALSRKGRVNKQAKKSGININDMFKEDFLLWIADADQSGDNSAGLLVEGRGEKTVINMMGGTIKPDKCGWNQILGNSVLCTDRPDGRPDTFKLYLLDDVRRLEKLGYNFATMKFETPQQIPIPGMGPKLNGLMTDPRTGKTTITFMVPEAYEVKLQIFDEDGREICNLLNCGPVPCMPVGGIHHVAWDGCDNDGEPVHSGKYICRFTAGEYQESKEIIFEQ